jgi:hypothetical protein
MADPRRRPDKATGAATLSAVALRVCAPRECYGRIAIARFVDG